MRFAFVAALAALTLWAAAPARAASTGEAVEFQAGKLAIKAMLFKPDGPGPFPAVIGMAGCEGLNNSSGALLTRYRDWAERLEKAGFATLFPDSLGARGIANQCRNRASVLHTNRERVADADAARDWLQQQPFIKPEHISLVGWANGGIAVLWSVRPHIGENRGKPDFRSAVAFYPGCNRLEATAWSARVPTLILIGSADDWASARKCEKMVANARGRSAKVTLVVYPGAYHDFDDAKRPVQMHTGNAFSVDGSGRVHTGLNASARADAFKRVPQWLAR